MQRSEEREQARLIKWSHKVATRALIPDLAWLHHSPNGGKRDGLTGGQLKALGVKPGFPDLILPAPSKTHPGLAIEMKSDKGRASPEQSAWLAHLSAHGWDTHILRSADAARLAICAYFGVDPASTPGLDP